MNINRNTVEFNCTHVNRVESRIIDIDLATHGLILEFSIQSAHDSCIRIHVYMWHVPSCYT